MNRTLTLSTAVVAVFLIAGCTGADREIRYPIDASPVTAAADTAAPVRLSVRSIEVRDVVMPAYAEQSQMLSRGEDGGLVPLAGAQWANASSGAITAELARSLDLRSTATIVAEPWPLSDPADVRLEVRIDRLIANADGNFLLGGQFAVVSSNGNRREFIERFDISIPIAEVPATPPALAVAYGAALGQLRDRILTALAR